MPSVRVTDAGVYLEVGGEWVRVTDAGLYIELKRTWARATDVGLYTELAGEWARVTNAGVYIELELPPPDFYAVGDGHDLAAAALTRLDPQPRCLGILVTRRNHSANQNFQDDAKHAYLEYDALEDATQYQEVLTQYGIKDQLENEVTVTLRDQDQEWKRWNATAVQPQFGGEDGQWRNYFPRNIKVLLKNMYLAA